MNEEELLKVLNKEKSYKEEDLLLFIYDLRKEIKQLQQENQSLKDRIEKAIEHINNIGFPDWEDHLQDICVSGKSLLKILKGDK